MGNKGVTLATNVIYNCFISDVMTCHKAMSTELFRSLRLRERGFAIEPEIAARVLRAGERIYEVPISYAARSREEGKKLTALDGLRVLRTLAPLPRRLTEPRSPRREPVVAPSGSLARPPARTARGTAPGPRRPSRRAAPRRRAAARARRAARRVAAAGRAAR